MNAPPVTVLMPVYNGERHVHHAIDSILSQTHREFEFVIVDDGSTDRTRELVSSYRDSRIRLVAMNRNVGLSAALNEGIRLAQAPLIARQDADDVSEPSRLARQFVVMAERPDLALLGSQAVAIAEDGTPTGIVRRPVAPTSIRWFSVFDNPFIHTSVMFRTDAVRALGGFDPKYDPFSQDYDLWCRLMEKYTVANLSDKLVRYRVSDTSISGALTPDGPETDYQRRFECILRELTTRQARRIFGADTISDADATLISGLVLGLDRTEVEDFLSVFERLLGRYREKWHDGEAVDFRWTLARQFDALAVRVRPATRASALTIYAYVLRRHAELARSVSWSRGLAVLLLGGAGRERLARWKRRHPSLARG
jgi:glycosyltransferase involved in cell wall biosynthesis